jgi:aspartokinase/homoserine dehydrogenase 1
LHQYFKCKKNKITGKGIKKMKILKFGGSSIKTPKRINQMINIVIKSGASNGNMAVIVSAFGGVTDDLIQISNKAAFDDETYRRELEKLENRHFDAVKALININSQSSILANVKLLFNELEDVLHGVSLIKELSNKSLDFILSFGERLSAYIISEAFIQSGIKTEFLDARLLIETDNNFGFAIVNYEKSSKDIINHFNTQNSLQIITGFIGSTSKGETTTLGRGGSDYTASLFATVLNAEEIEIWTDVNGVLTADPKKVKNSFPIRSMSYEEAMEMSHFGAKVIHPPTIQPAFEQKIPIRIKNTFQPEFEGTLICEKPTPNNGHLIKGISSIDSISLLRVQGSGMIGAVGTSGRLFSALAKKNINTILITQASSEHSICFAVNPIDADRAKVILEKEFQLEMQVHHIDKIIVEKNLAIIAIVGEKMRKTIGIAAKTFQALAESKVNVVAIAQGSSELNISVVVDKKDETKALNAVHDNFFLSSEIV